MKPHKKISDLDFDPAKKKQLALKDASFKGSIDKPIAGLIEKVNSLPNYYTTSSCSGRITLVIDSEKKKEGLLAFTSHDKMNLNQLKKEIEKLNSKEMLWFKQRPCILHVACRTLQDAQALLNKAKLAGWKRSGIMASSKRILCELWSTEEIAFPIWQNKLLVDDNFLSLTLEKASLNLEKSWKKINALEKSIA